MQAPWLPIYSFNVDNNLLIEIVASSSNDNNP